MQQQLPPRDFTARSHRGPRDGAAAHHFSVALLHPRLWPQWLGLGVLSLMWLLLPGRWRDGLGMLIGSRLAKGRWPRRIPLNLARCFPQMSAAEQQRVVREHAQAQVCVLLDLPALWLGRSDRLRARVRVQGAEHLERAFEAGRPVCMLVSHSLGLEHAAQALKSSYPMLGYYKPFGAPVVDWLFYRSRCRNGGYLLQRGDSFRSLVRDVREGWSLYMMIDEDMGEQQGHWAPFFATQKCGIKAPAKLTALTGALAVPIYSWYNLREHRYEIRVSEPLADFPSGDSSADVARMLAALQQMIEQHPAQYGWRQQLFRSGS